MIPGFTQKEWKQFNDLFTKANRQQKEMMVLMIPSKDSMKISTLYGIEISRIKELMDLFSQEGYNIVEDKDWEALKLRFFNK